MFEPKPYQLEALAALEQCLTEYRKRPDPESAFKWALQAQGVANPAPYQFAANPDTKERYPELAKIPTVCIRLPTGGGKTYLAACAIGTCAHALHPGRKNSLVLWLTPTNTIREQTLKTLETPGHPNRAALEAAHGSNLLVKDITDFTELRPHDLATRTCIVVGTLATPRISETEKRKVYAHHEELEGHFSTVSPAEPGLELATDQDRKGKIKFSFMNLLALHRPLVIVDEAHNASSDLSYEVLERIRPSCVVEFTATPAKNSNILFAVSASVLKAESMIKLPIMLTSHQRWEEAVHDALMRRKQLARLAKDEPDYLRPIVLLQAEDKNQQLTVDALQRYLLDVEKVEPKEIAVVTGSRKELSEVNLLARSCPVTVVVTVDALKEGWDCPFAYVFCSVANVHSPRAVEQFLGRVLRMPYARERHAWELNMAYAHVSRDSWPNAVAQLRERLVSMGFDKMEAQSFVYQQNLIEPEQPPSLEWQLDAVPALPGLSPEDADKVAFLPNPDGGVTLKLSGDVSPEGEETLVTAVPAEKRVGIRVTLAAYRKATQSPPITLEFARPEPFARIPLPCVTSHGELLLLNQNMVRETTEWDLLACDVSLSEVDLPGIRDTEVDQIDVDQDQLTIRHLGSQPGLPYQDEPVAFSVRDVIRQIADELQRHDSWRDQRPEVRLKYVQRTLDWLMDTRHVKLETLFRDRFRLVEAIGQAIDRHRADALKQGFIKLTMSGLAIDDTRDRFCFAFNPNQYPAKAHYGQHPYELMKHYYSVIAAFDSKEELEAALAIDRCKEVRHWVRNIASQPLFSFHLPTAAGEFYPDFVAELLDGRVMVAEYKGAHLEFHDQEKRMIGERWEDASKGKCLFVWLRKTDEQGRGLADQLAVAITKHHARWNP
jgi:type III restriction enzyme